MVNKPKKAATTNIKNNTSVSGKKERNITHGRRRRRKAKAKVIESERCVGEGIKYRSVMRKKHEFLWIGLEDQKIN